MTLKVEVWRTVPGTDEVYLVSSTGRVRSLRPWRKKTDRVLTPKEDRYGYLALRIVLPDGRKWNTRVHQLVAAAFLGRRPDGSVVNHKDGVKTNNQVENLEYVTPTENNLHAARLGLSPPVRGEANGMARLTENEVRSIRAIYPAKTTYELAAMFGVSQPTVSEIIRFATWKHVK